MQRKEITLKTGEIYSINEKKYQVLIDVGEPDNAWIVSSRESIEEALKASFRWLKENGHLEDDGIYQLPDLEEPDFTGATEGDR